MKTKRIIWGAFCAVSFIALSIYAGTEWYAQGCRGIQLVALLSQYAMGAGALWVVVDAAIKGE